MAPPDLDCIRMQNKTFEMTRPGALDLPEIRNAIGPFLIKHNQDLLSCCLVSRAWHASFLPFLGQKITLSSDRQGRPLPTLQQLESFAHRVQSLSWRKWSSLSSLPPATRRIDDSWVMQQLAERTLTIPRELVRIPFPRLTSLSMTFNENSFPPELTPEKESFRAFELTAVLCNCPNLTVLMLQDNLQWEPLLNVWSTLETSCLNLRKLSLANVTFETAWELEPLLRVAERLQSLILEDVMVRLDDVLENIFEWANTLPTSGLEMLVVGGRDGMSGMLLLVLFMGRSRNLVRLSCDFLVKATAMEDGAVEDEWDLASDNVPAKVLVDFMASTQWPHLSELEFHFKDSANAKDKEKVQPLSDQEWSKILDSLPCLCSRFIPLSHSRVGPATFQSLGRHFETLTYLIFLPPSSEAPSPVGDMAVQTILSSCPNLVFLRASVLYASHVDPRGEGFQPWVCLGLQKLKVEILFNVPEAVQDGTASSSSTSSVSATGNATKQKAIKGAKNKKGSNWFMEISKPATNIFDQRPIFQQLARLTQLQQLSVSHVYTPPKGWRNGVDYAPLDLRLGKGFELLTGLTRLQKFSFLKMRQLIGGEEARWMVNHWKSLQFLQGGIHRGFKGKKEVERVMAMRGVHVYLKD